jgi:hypothetical protein
MENTSNVTAMDNGKVTVEVIGLNGKVMFEMVYKSYRAFDEVKHLIPWPMGARYCVYDVHGNAL